jgi:hypothetical protein
VTEFNYKLRYEVKKLQTLLQEEEIRVHDLYTEKVLQKFLISNPAKEQPINEGADEAQ